MNNRSCVYIKGKSLVLNARYPYDIELNRIDTPIKAYEWLVHLLEKNWITREILFEMVDVLQNHFGYNLHSMEETAPEGKVTAAHVSKVVREMIPGKTEASISVINEDSDSLFQLKRWWKKATIKDHKMFLKWVESQERK